MRPLIVSGSPGSGKTSVSRLLASQCAQGVHLVTDRFFDFVPNLIDPSLPTSKKQNQAIVAAYSHAAAAYAARGFSVYIDGVIGPWWFAEIHPIVGDFDFILLRVSIESAQRRVSARTGQPSARPSVVDRMFPQFQALEEEFSHHLIDSDTYTVAEMAALIENKRTQGECVISLDTIQHSRRGGDNG